MLDERGSFRGINPLIVLFTFSFAVRCGTAKESKNSQRVMTNMAIPMLSATLTVSSSLKAATLLKKKTSKTKTSLQVAKTMAALVMK